MKTDRQREDGAIAMRLAGQEPSQTSDLAIWARFGDASPRTGPGGVAKALWRLRARPDGLSPVARWAASRRADSPSGLLEEPWVGRRAAQCLPPDTASPGLRETPCGGSRSQASLQMPGPWGRHSSEHRARALLQDGRLCRFVREECRGLVRSLRGERGHRPCVPRGSP